MLRLSPNEACCSPFGALAKDEFTRCFFSMRKVSGAKKSLLTVYLFQISVVSNLSGGGLGGPTDGGLGPIHL